MDHALLFLASQIQKEHSMEHLLICFIVVLMVRFLKPKLLKQHKTHLEQYPLAPTSTANRSTLQPLSSRTLFSGKYLLTLTLYQASIFPSHGHVSSYFPLKWTTSVTTDRAGKSKVPVSNTHLQILFIEPLFVEIWTSIIFFKILNSL